MVDFSGYLQFTREDAEPYALYMKARELPNLVIKSLANGEYFECNINNQSYRFLHATFGEQDWYEIFLEG